jgi:hypothetical protein
MCEGGFFLSKSVSNTVAQTFDLQLLNAAGSSGSDGLASKNAYEEQIAAL